MRLLLFLPHLLNKAHLLYWLLSFRKLIAVGVSKKIPNLRHILVVTTGAFVRSARISYKISIILHFASTCHLSSFKLFSYFPVDRSHMSTSEMATLPGTNWLQLLRFGCDFRVSALITFPQFILSCELQNSVACKRSKIRSADYSCVMCVTAHPVAGHFQMMCPNELLWCKNVRSMVFGWITHSICFFRCTEYVQTFPSSHHRNHKRPTCDVVLNILQALATFPDFRAVNLLHSILRILRKGSF